MATSPGAQGLLNRLITNLIQGVSQQDPALRRDSQCELQENCVNSVRLGALSREGAELIKKFDGDFSNAFAFTLENNFNESYVVLLTGNPASPVKIIQVDTGDEATVIDATGGMTYLTTLSGYAPRDVFAAQQVNDWTFIANRVVAPTFTGAVGSSRPREAMLFVRAGAYCSNYILTLTYAGTRYKFRFTTPDNQAAGNAVGITTNYIASVFYHLLTGTAPESDPNTSPYGAAGLAILDPSTGYDYTLDSGSNEVPPGWTNAAAIGFGVEINGNLLRIYRDDGNDFEVDVSDGQGESAFLAIKDQISGTNKLPQGGFPGFYVKITGDTANQTGTGYWMEYVNRTGGGGYWRERVAPGAPTTLNPTTMPHAFLNSGVLSFTFASQTWSTRIAGDGIVSAKPPNFIGRAIQDITYHQQRLAFLTDGGVDFSKARNPFTFFPDTVQTVLDDASITATLASAGANPITRRFSQAEGGLMVWGQKKQYRITSNTAMAFTQQSIEAPPSTAYVFAEYAKFGYAGTTLYFASELDNFATITQVVFGADGKVQGELDTTSHVAEYVPVGVRAIEADQTTRSLAVRTDGDQNSLYFYNWLRQGDELVQAAWNRWTFPSGTLVWHGFRKNTVRLLLQRGDGLYLLSVPLATGLRDPGNVGYQYRTRLDFLLYKASTGVSCAYDESTETSTLTVPYVVQPEELEHFRLVNVDGGGEFPRGRLWTPTARNVVGSTTVLTFPAIDLTAMDFACGIRVYSFRDESTFHLRTSDGERAVDTLTVKGFRLHCHKTAYTRLEISRGEGWEDVEQELRLAPNFVYGEAPRMQTHQLYAEVGQDAEKVTIRMINDSPFPSRWIRADYEYTFTDRSRQDGGR